MNKTFKISMYVVIIGFLCGMTFFLMSDDFVVLNPSNNISFNVEKSSFMLFLNSFFSYNKYILLTFFMGFISYGFIICYILLFVRCISLGFTTIYFIVSSGLSGVMEIFKIYLIQNILFVFLLMIVSIFAYKFNIKYMNKKYTNIKDILFVYIFVEIIIILICLYESLFLKLFL